MSSLAMGVAIYPYIFLFSCASVYAMSPKNNALGKLAMTW